MILNKRKAFPIVRYVLTMTVCASCVAVVSAALYGQGKKSVPQTGQQFAVEWVGEFCTREDFAKKRSVPGKIFNFFFGGREYALIKPMNVLAVDSLSLFILDQGTRSVSFVDIPQKKFDFFETDDHAAFPSLVSICRGRDDTVYFSDSALNKIYAISEGSNTAREVALDVSLQQPTGVAYSRRSDRLWVVETAAHQIRVFDARGALVNTIGTRGTSDGAFNFPTFIWIDRSGLVYVVDSMNFRIQIFSDDGSFVGRFGEQGDATGYFARPKGVATDSFGHIYVADALLGIVQVFERDGKLLSYFGSPGQGRGEFWLPAGIFIADNDMIYVADSYNSRIQMFKLQVKRRDEK